MPQPERDNTLCKYHMHGACTRGSSCPFSHDLHELPNTVCTHWLKGHCSFGDKCRYEHKHPEWAPRIEAENKGYEAPPIPKPATDNLEDMLPISRLRLSGKAAPPAPVQDNHSNSSSADSAVIALQAMERRSPPPVELPADPFGAGEGSSLEHEARIAALALDGGIGSLPDDLGLGQDIELPPIEREFTEEFNPLSDNGLGLSTAYSAEHLEGAHPDWHSTGSGGGGGGGAHHHTHQLHTEGEVFTPAGVYSGGQGGEIYHSDAAYAYEEAEAAYDQGEYGGGGEHYETGVYEHYNGTAGNGSTGYGSYGEHQGGAYMAMHHGGGGGGGASSSGPGSSGNSPHFGAWHIPGNGTGSDGGWGGGMDMSRFYANPGLQSLCYEHYSTGVCSQGDACHMAHGDLCETCQHYALHPVDTSARESHIAECHARHERLLARARSAHVECGICLERVLEKVNGDRKFGLLDCEHSFCLSCIRSWRQNLASGADVESALRTCPMCRIPTHFITPSTIWPATPEEREAIVSGYKAKLASIDCRHFNYGEGTCPFGTSCMYRHRYPDGRLEESAPRRVVADEGEVRVVQQPTLFDFIQIKSKPRGRRR